MERFPLFIKHYDPRINTKPDEAARIETTFPLVVDTAHAKAARFAAMDNEEIARRFFRLAALMDIRGDDPFRLRSYRNAAEAIETWPMPMQKIAAAEGLAGFSRYPGGKAIAGKL